MFDEHQPNLNQLGYLLAEASRTVVFVVGAGVSRPAGVPLWPELHESLKRIAISFVNKSKKTATEKEQQLREISDVKDPWHLGDVLEQAIPQEVYDREIRKMLTPSGDCSTYEQLWDLKPSGMVSFNLDTLARRALKGTDDQYASAVDTSRYERFLLLSRPFLFQVHGSLEAKKSWVLGARSRNHLLKDSNYRDFVKALL